MSNKKKDSKKILAIVMVALAVGAVLPAFGVLPQLSDKINFGSTTTVSIAPGTSSGSVVSGCGVEDTTVKLSALNKYTAAATSGTHAYKVNGGAKSTVSDAGTFTASPGDKLEVLFENEASGSNYFGVQKTYTVPCKGTYDITEDLVQNGTFSIDIFNEEGDLIAYGTNETLAAGDTVYLDYSIHAENKKGFPHGGVIIIELNSTQFDEENTYFDLDGRKLNKVSVPGSYSINRTDDVALAFEVPAFEGATKHSGTLFLDVDDTYGPSDGAVEQLPMLTFEPKDYYINEDTGASFDGPAVDDEDNAQAFGHKTTTLLYVD